MKIITICPTMNTGGAEKVCLRLHALMTARGIESHLVVLTERGQYTLKKNDRVHVLPVPTARSMDLWPKKQKVTRLLQTLLDQISADGPIDAIFSHLDEAHIITVRMNTSARRYYVVHTSVAEEVRTTRERGWLKQVRLRNKKRSLNGQNVICVSEGLADEVRSLDWLHPRKVYAIYNPLDIEQVQAESADAVEVSVDDYIIHIGRFARAKRHDVLFDAFAKVLQKRPTLKLVLLTKLSKSLTRELERRKLTDHVVTPGLQQNPYPWINKAHLLVLSSDFEGFPNVLVEALMCNTPVVSTTCPHGPSEILANYHEDWLVPLEDPAALAATIDRVLAEQPDVKVADWPLLQEVSPQRIVDQYLSLAATDAKETQ